MALSAFYATPLLFDPRSKASEGAPSGPVPDVLLVRLGERHLDALVERCRKRLMAESDTMREHEDVLDWALYQTDNVGTDSLDPLVRQAGDRTSLAEVRRTFEFPEAGRWRGEGALVRALGPTGVGWQFVLDRNGTAYTLATSWWGLDGRPDGIQGVARRLSLYSYSSLELFELLEGLATRRPDLVCRMLEESSAARERSASGGLLPAPVRRLLVPLLGHSNPEVREAALLHGCTHLDEVAG